MEKALYKKAKSKITIVPSKWLKIKMEKWEAWRKLETPASLLSSAPALTI